MEYLVTMTTHVPEGTPEEDVQEIRAREAARSRELAAQGHLLRLWRPPLQPGEWRTLGLFAAGGGGQLEEVLASMPLRVWRTDAVTVPCVAGTGGSVPIPPACRLGLAGRHRVAGRVQHIPGAAEVGQPLALGHARTGITGEGLQRRVVVGDLEVPAGVLDRPEQRGLQAAARGWRRRPAGEQDFRPLPSAAMSVGAGDLPPCSVVSRYSVWPCPLTRTAPTAGDVFGADRDGGRR